MLNNYDDSQMSYNELIEAIIAAGNPYAGRNSKLDRSLRARRQLRDRKGRWIYMGGGLGFTVRMPDGTLYRVLGRSVGASRREGFVQVYIPDGTAEGLPGGFYDVPASGSDVVQAILPGQEGAGKYTGSPTAAEIVNLGDLQVKDAPDGWRKNRDGSYTSEGSEFTVTAPDAEGKVKLQRDGRTVATLRDPATAIARAAKIDIEGTVDTDTKKVVARLKKDVTEARRSLRDSTTEEEATQAQEALKKSAEQVDRALFNDPEIMGEQDFEAERRAKELSGLQAQDEELDRENSEIETQLEGMNRRTAEAQKLKARQREIAEERADISDSIAELSPQPETDGPTPPDGTDTPQAGPDEDGDGEPDYYVDPNTGEIIDNEPDEVLEDGGVYILDGDRVQEEDVADWLSKAPEYSQIFIKGTNADGQPELYKFIKSPSGDWIEFSFTSETIPIRTSKDLADFMRDQRTNGGLVASDESAINGGDLQTIEDALDDLRLEAEGRRERRPGDFQRARERARRVLDGDSGVEFEEGFDPENQEVVSFDREDGPPKEFYRPKKMWANYFHKNDWVEGQDGKWRKVVSKETFTEMRPSTDPNKGPYSFRRHTITFDDGSTYEIETKNGWPDSQEKKNEFQVVRETKDRRFEALDQQEQPAQPVEPAETDQAPAGQPVVEPIPDSAPAAGTQKAVEDAVDTADNAEQQAEETADPEVADALEETAEEAKAEVEAAPVKPPRAPREPSIGATTGRLAELLKNAKTPEEVRDIINGEEITYIDFETTGFSAVPGDGELNRPLQMGIVKVKNGEVTERKNIWMNPDTELSEWSRNNLKDADGNPISPEWLAEQPSIADAMREATEFMGPNAIIAGQNVQFDLEVLGRTLREQGLDYTWDGTLDSRDMSAGSLPKYDPETGVGPNKTNRDGTKSHSNSLGDIVDFLNEEGFPVTLENAHSADADALASHEVVQAMLQRAINTDTPLDFMWNNTGKPEEWAAYNREYAKYRDQLRDYFTATNDPNIEDRMAQAEPVRLEDLAPAFSGQAPERTPDTAEVSATETAVDDANATVDELDDQLDRTVDQDEASDILDALVDEVEKADTAQTAAAKAIVASNDDEAAALNRHIDRLDRQIQRQIDRDQDPSDLMAEQEALIEQRDNLERGVTDGPGADAFRGGQAFLSLTESGPNSSRVKLERRGDSLRNLDGDVVARLIPQVSNADERRERGEVVVDLFEVEKGFEGVFVDAISEAKAANKKYGSSVDVHDEEYYANARVFISEDGLIGAALNDGEEIVSVFRHPNAAQGVAGPIVGKLVELGGRRLDAMDTILPYIYAREGFKPVGRIDWVEKFAPDGWDKEVYAKYKKGEPDVVFMVFDPERIGSDYTPGEGTKYEDYDQAMDVAVKAVADSRTPELDGFNFSSLAPALRIPDDAPDFQTGPVTQDESGRPSVAALRASKVGQVIEYTFANGRKGRFVKMSRDIWRRADNPNDTKKYFSSNFRADENLAFAEPTDADIPSVEPTPARKFAAIDPRPYAVPRNLSPEEYQTLRNVYADQVENGTTERDRRRAEETVYLLDRIIARNEGRTLPRRADRVTRSIQRRQRAAGQAPAATPQPSQPAEAPEAPVAPETPEAAAPATPERKTYPLRTDNPDSSFLDPAPYESQGTGVDGTTDNPAELIDLFDQATLAEAFNKALRDQESAINLEFPNGNSALIPTEAVRDALQILGVNTTVLTEESSRSDREILDENRPQPRTRPLGSGKELTPEEELGNLYNTVRGWQDELVRFMTANPNAKAQIEALREKIAGMQRKIAAKQAQGIRNPYDVEGIDVRDKMQVDNSKSRRPEIAWQAIQDMYPEGTLLNDKELLVATNTITDSRGNQFTYSAIITRTDDEQFYTYIREENHSEPDPAKKFKSMRVTSFRHSAEATRGRGLDGADFAIGRVMSASSQGRIESWFNNRSARKKQGMYVTSDTVDEQGTPVHTPQRVITRDALTRIKEATNSDDVSEEMIYTLYNYIAEFGSGGAVLNELAKSFNIDDATVFRFVDAVNENLGNRDHLDKFVLWESNTGVPLFENDRVTYVGTSTQRGARGLSGKTGRVQIRNLIHTTEERGVRYSYTDYVYVQFEDENGNPEGTYRIVAAKNLRIDRTSGGTDGSERIGPNAISIPRPVLTQRALNRNAMRNTTQDIMEFTAEYDRSDPANPTVTIDGQEYGVQVSRSSTISDNLSLRTVQPQDMEVGDLFFTYDEETGTKRLAEVVGVDTDENGNRLVTTAIPVDLGSAKVSRTSYPADFDMPFEVYREVEPMQRITAPGEDAPEPPITSAHLDRLRDMLVRADKNNIDRDILAKAFRTIDSSDGGAQNLREYEDILREVFQAVPADGMREQGRMSIEEAAQVIYNSLNTGSPNPEAEAWLRRVIDAGIVREDDLRNDPEVPEDAVATPAAGTLPTTTARPAPTQRVNAPAAPTSPGEPVTRQWFWDAEPGARVTFTNMYGDGTSATLRKTENGTWIDEDGAVMYDTTRDLVADYAQFPDMADAYAILDSDGSISAVPVAERVAGDSADEQWIRSAREGEYVQITKDDGTTVVYLARRIPLGEPGNDITWTPVVGMVDSGFNAIETNQLISKYMTPDSPPVQILGRNFYRWDDTPPGRSVPNDVAWYANSPAGTTVNFTITTRNADGTSQDIQVNARKYYSGDWGITNVPGQPDYSQLLNSYELVQFIPDSGANRGRLEVVPLPEGQRIDPSNFPGGGSNPLDDKSYNQIATGPYSPEDAVTSVTPEEFQKAISDGDEAVIRQAIGEAFSNRRFGSQYRLSRVSITSAPGSFTLRADITNANDVVVGTVVRDYEIDYRGEFNVHHSKIWITDSSNRRTGFASEFKDFSKDFYNYMGVDKINIHTVDDGSLVWAKMGYTWSDPSQSGAIKYKLDHVLNIVRQSGNQEDIKVLEDLMDRFNLPYDHIDFPDPIDLAYLEYAEPGDHTYTLGHDLLHGSGWWGVMYLNPNLDPRPEERQLKTPDDFKDGKYKKFDGADKSGGADDPASRYVDSNGNIEDAFRWLDVAKDNSYVYATDNLGVPALYKKVNGLWIRAQYGDKGKTLSELQSVSEMDLANYIGTNRAKVPTQDEISLYESYFSGDVDTSKVSRDDLELAFRTANLPLIESVLRNSIYGDGNRRYGEVVIEAPEFYIRKFTQDGIQLSNVTVDAQLSYAGETVGHLSRTFTIDTRGNLSVKHGALVLNQVGANGRRKGFGSNFTESSEKFYEKMDVQHSSLEAWWDGGWYWADKGYGWDTRFYTPGDPIENIMGKIPQRLKEELELARDEQRTEDTAEVAEILERMARLKPTDRLFPTPQQIRALTNGKKIMDNSRWAGIKYHGTARPDPEKLREQEGAPQLDGWTFLATQNEAETSVSIDAAIQAGYQAYLGMYGDTPKNRRDALEGLKQELQVYMGDYFVYERDGVTLLVDKDQAQSEVSAKVIELQQKLFDKLRPQSGIPITFRLSNRGQDSNYGNAIAPYQRLLFSPNRGMTVNIYMNNVTASRLPGPSYTRAANPAFGDFAVGALAHEWGHIIDFDSSGMRVGSDDSSRYMSRELERRIKAYDQANGTDFWNSISDYVNSPGINRLPETAQAPSHRLMEAWAESFAQFVAEEYFGDTSGTVIASIVRDILRERGYLQ